MMLPARLANARAVTIGVTRACRPADLPGVEEGIGLFIETLPLHRPLPPSMPAADWLRELPGVQAGQERHGHLGLAEIQRLGRTGGELLFEALFVFENYPLGAETRTSAVL